MKEIIMDKIIIHLIIPAISQEYDLYIPTTISIKELTDLMVRAVKEITNNLYVSSGKEFLCLKEKNILLIQEFTVESYGIQNGDHIVLI